MSDLIPFDIQSEIMKRLPVKSLIQFRSVSKKWKCFIDSPKFIKNYHINHTNPHHHLLIRYELDTIQTYTSIIDNDTFPQQKFTLTAPESLRLLRHTLTLSSIDGLLCFYGDVDSKTTMVVIWNPSVRKSVGIVIPNPKAGYVVVGFGVCPHTRDPKLVKIVVDRISSMWVVEAFTLSARVWKTVYVGAPFKSCNLLWNQVFAYGVIYFRGADEGYLYGGVKTNFVILFDFKSEKFGEVCLPDRLVHTPYLDLVKVNESLGLLEYYSEGEIWVCGVWSRTDGANEPFTNIYNVKIEIIGLYPTVLEFRNNGGVVMEMIGDDNNEGYRIEVYEPSSGNFNVVGLNGKADTISVRSYMETLLLLDESDSIIH